MPKAKDPKTGDVKHFPYTAEGMAAAEKMKKAGGKMMKGKKGKGRKK